jgi:hypothetical protein
VHRGRFRIENVWDIRRIRQITRNQVSRRLRLRFGIRVSGCRYLGNLRFHPQVIEDREKILIGFFGEHTLLNRQPGCRFPTYLPTRSDSRLFATLATRLFNIFAREEQDANVQLQEKILALGRLTLDYANSHLVECLTNRFPMTDEYTQRIAEQATPKTWRHHTLIAIVGKNVICEAFTPQSKFFVGEIARRKPQFGYSATTPRLGTWLCGTAANAFLNVAIPIH